MTDSRGFTLVELIVVMVIIGVLAGVVAVFITGPVTGYVDANRRAQLSDAADIAVMRISTDLRLALPNSVRIGGSNQFLEYIPTAAGSRYRSQSGAGADPLRFTGFDDSFDYFGPSLVGQSGHVVVFNTGQRSPSGNCTPAPGGADAYEGCNRSLITGITAASPGGNISMNSVRFRLESPSNRFHIVPATGPVTLACENVNTVNGNGTGTLRIYSNYATGNGDWGATAPAAAPAVAGQSNHLLTEHVSACDFTYTPGVTATNGLVMLRLALTRGNETVNLLQQIYVENTP
jgi:MSHA biogenesis protein MshO